MNCPPRHYSAAILLLMGMLWGCSEQQAPSTDAPSIEGRPVKVIAVGQAEQQINTRYPAVIDAAERTELSFSVAGNIVELLVNDSESVEAGDVIARLDGRDFESNVDSAQATFANAEDEYQRAVRLAEQDAIARNVLEQRETQRDVARAQLDTAQKALADTVLRSPFTGVVANVPVREQQTIAAGSTVATVIGLESLEATINLPANVLAQVPTHDKGGAMVLLDVAPDLEIQADFSEADLVADATSQTYAVTFAFRAPDNLLILPGMNATVVLSADDVGAEVASGVVVPLAAVQSDGAGQYVWIVEPSTMAATRRDIEVAPGIGDTVLVTAGLASGEQIVGAGGAYLAEGVKVTPWTE